MTHNPHSDPDDESFLRYNDSSEIIEAIEACGFQLVEPHKLGGQGVVLRMKNTRLKRIVAVKIPLNTSSTNGNFEEEAQTLAQLSHPNIVNVYSFGLGYSESSSKSFPYIEMEFISGPSLRELLTEHGCLPEEVAVEISKSICLGLHEIHDSGIDHADIKPSNILFRSAVTLVGEKVIPTPVIIDFGIARSTLNQNDSIPSGTPNYVAPEQQAGKPVHRASDIYSIGKLLNELLTSNRDSQLTSGEKLKSELHRIAQKCCEPNPANRYATAFEVGMELDRYANRIPILTGETSVSRRATLNLRRLKWWYVGAIAAMVLVSAGMFWNVRSIAAEAKSHQKELEGYALEAANIEKHLRGKADIQDAQLELLNGLESRLNESSKKWKNNPYLAAKHARVLTQCASIHRTVGDIPAAIKRNEEAIEVLQKVSDSSDTESLRALAVTHLNLGLIQGDQEDAESAIHNFSETERLFELCGSRADGKWNDWANASSGAVNRAVVLERQGNHMDSLKYYARSRELLFFKKEENPFFEEDHAFILNNEAGVRMELGQHREALKLVHNAMDIRKKLYRDEPTHQRKKFELAQTIMNFGIIATDAVYARPAQGFKEDPIQHLNEAVELYEDLVEDNPKVVEYKYDLVKVKCIEANTRYRKYAEEHGENGDRLDVEEDVARVAELCDSFELDGQLTIATSIFYLSAGRASRDKDLIESAVAKFEMMANHYSDMAELKWHLGWAYEEADKFYSAEQGQKSRYASDRATERYARAFDLQPDNYKYYLSYRQAIESQITKHGETTKEGIAWEKKLLKLKQLDPSLAHVQEQ